MSIKNGWILPKNLDEVAGQIIYKNALIENVQEGEIEFIKEKLEGVFEYLESSIDSIKNNNSSDEEENKAMFNTFSSILETAMYIHNLSISEYIQKYVDKDVISKIMKEFNDES